MNVDGSEGLHGQQGTVFPHPLVGDREIKFGKSNEYVVGMVLAGVVLAAAGAVVGAVQERRVNE